MGCLPFLSQRMARRAMCRGPKYSAGSPSSSRRIASIPKKNRTVLTTSTLSPSGRPWPSAGSWTARWLSLIHISFYYIKFIKNKPKTKGDTDLDDYDYGEDEEPAGEENLDEDAEEEMDDEFAMDAEPEDEKL